MTIPDICMDCRFRSKAGTCYNYMKLCKDVALECEEDDRLVYAIETTKNRQWLTMDELKALNWMHDVFKKEY